jgi:hypothetical protein
MASSTRSRWNVASSADWGGLGPVPALPATALRGGRSAPWSRALDRLRTLRTKEDGACEQPLEKEVSTLEKERERLEKSPGGLEGLGNRRFQANQQLDRAGFTTGARHAG